MRRQRGWRIASDWRSGPASRDEDDPKAIRVREGDPVRPPIRVCGLHRGGANALTHLCDGGGASEIEDEERLGVWCRWACQAAARELDLRIRPWNSQEHAVVTIVVVEAPDFRQSDPVAVEAHELLESLRLSRDTELHHLHRLVREDLCSVPCSAPRSGLRRGRSFCWTRPSSLAAGTTSARTCRPRCSRCSIPGPGRRSAPTTSRRSSRWS